MRWSRLHFAAREENQICRESCSSLQGLSRSRARYINRFTPVHLQASLWVFITLMLSKCCILLLHNGDIPSTQTMRPPTPPKKKYRRHQVWGLVQLGITPCQVSNIPLDLHRLHRVRWTPNAIAGCWNCKSVERHGAGFSK